MICFEAKRWALEQGAEKPYISVHSAVDSKAFYREIQNKTGHDIFLRFVNRFSLCL